VDSLTDNEQDQLQQLGFRADVFDTLVEDFVAGRFPSNSVQGTVTPPPEGSILPPPSIGTMQGDAVHDGGYQLLSQGRAGLVLLNGGMATRFGGRVKGVVDALPGRSFLALQVARLVTSLRELGTAPALLVMNSEATDQATREHFEQNDYFGLPQDRVRFFKQSGAPRLRPDGSLYRDEEGAISIYGPGHGDLLPALRRTGALRWAREQGVEVLLVANVDNLGATLDPQLLGMFAASGDEMMVEVVRKDEGDVGGCPAQVDGRLCIVEGFAFPEGFDQSAIPVFNTNTLWFRSDAVDRELPLRWYAVKKQADGAEVLQFEQLVGQASWFLDTAWVEVPRQRFLPVKSPADLEAVQGRLRGMFGVRLDVL